MVPSSSIAVAAHGEHLMCGEFSLGDTIRLGIITGYFSDLSLPPRRGDVGDAIMGSTHSVASTPQRAMRGNSTKEFLKVPSGEGSFGLPSPRRHGTGASLTPITTTPQMENALATQSTMTVPPWMAALQPETGLPSA
jgi:hypothetical protein